MQSRTATDDKIVASAKAAKPRMVSPRVAARPARMLALQRRVGNRATSSLAQPAAKQKPKSGPEEGPASPVQDAGPESAQPAEAKAGAAAPEAPAGPTGPTGPPGAGGAPSDDATGAPGGDPKAKNGKDESAPSGPEAPGGPAGEAPDVAPGAANGDSGSGDPEVAERDAPQLEAFTAKSASAKAVLTSRPPTRSQVAEVGAAAVGPANEKIAGGKAAQIGDMDAAPAGTFDRAAFIAAVEAAVANKAPKTLEGADDLAGSGAMSDVKSEISSNATAKSEQAAGQVDAAATAEPNPERGKAKQSAPLPERPTPRPPASVGAAEAMPKQRPPAETDLSKEPAEVDAQMRDEGVTEEQLAESDEPEFIDALDAKKTGDQHSKTEPPKTRATESQVIAGARGAAKGLEATGLRSMLGSRVSGDAAAKAQKLAGKGTDEQARAKVSAELEAIHARTKADATAILDGLEAKVTAEFDVGEAAARQVFEATHKREMNAWKDKRYSGISGKLRWAKDKIFDPPAEANRIFDRARTLYLAEMRKVIVKVADVVGRELTAAKERIAAGRKEVDNYIARLPKDLQAIGNELGDELDARFDALDADVQAKQGEMVTAVANKYSEASAAIDAKVEELKAANRGLWGKAKAKIAGVINTIRKLKDALMSALSGAASAIALIIAKPKRFFDNLGKAIGDGLRNFVSNIGAHLKRGVIGWLTGTLADNGIETPKSFDLKGIIGLILQVLGLTWTSIRSRIAKKLGPAGAKLIEHVESGVAVIGALAKEGPVALWNIVANQVSNLWDMVMGKLEDFLITKVIKAGITWLIGLLNPVAGFIKVCKAIIDLVMWFMNNAGRVAALIKSITGSVMAIAKGATGAASKAIEDALARTLPLAIGFLASLIGVGGLGQKVKEIIHAVRKPVTRAVDFVVDKAVGFGRKVLNTPVGRALMGGAKKGIEFGRRKVKQAKEWGTEKAQSMKKRVYGGDDSPDGQRKRLELAMDSAVKTVNKYAGRKVRRLTLDPQLKLIKVRRGIGHLDVKPIGGMWAVEGRIQRMSAPTDAQVDTEDGAGDRGEEFALVARPVVQGRSTADKPGRELGSVREVPVRLSSSSVSMNRHAIEMWVDRGTGSDVEKEVVRQYALERLSQAASTTQERSVHRRLREAASRIETLHPNGSLKLEIEHLTEVSQNPHTFVRSRIERKIAEVSGNLSKRRATDRAQRDLLAIDDKSRRNEIARLYAEQLVDAELTDQLGGVQYKFDPSSAVDVDLVMITKEHHAEQTSRRKRERAGSGIPVDNLE